MSFFQHIDKSITGAAKQYRLEAAMTKYKVMSLWEESLTAFVGSAKGQTQAIRFEHGVLTVACLSESLAKDINLFSDRILHALNQLVGRNVVREIVVET